MLERNIHTYTIREQLALHNAKAVVLGCGGGGCTMAEVLCRMGVGEITLVDFDRFEDSNKNRQLGATEKSLGKYKVIEMRRRLIEINPRCKVIPRAEAISKDNYKELLLGKDIILDAVDKRVNKEMVGDFVKELGLTYTTGGLGGYNFWCATLVNKSVRDIFGESQEDIPVYPCASGVLMQGALQAQQAVNHYLRRNTNTDDKVIKQNLMTLSMSVEDI